MDEDNATAGADDRVFWEIAGKIERMLCEWDQDYPYGFMTVGPGRLSDSVDETTTRGLHESLLNLVQRLQSEVDGRPWILFQDARWSDVLSSPSAWTDPEGSGLARRDENQWQNSLLCYWRMLELDSEDVCAHFALACEHLFDECGVDQEIRFENYLGEREFLTRQRLRALEKADGPDGEGSTQDAEVSVLDEAETRPQVWEVNEYYRWSKERAAEYVEERGRQLWESAAGDHLRRFLSGGGVAALLSRTEALLPLESYARFLHQSRDGWWVERFLFELGAILPSEDRADFYNHAFWQLWAQDWTDEAAGQRYLDEALKWVAEDDDPLRLSIYLNMARLRITSHDLVTCSELLEVVGQDLDPAQGSSDEIMDDWLSLAGWLAREWQEQSGEVPVTRLWEQVLSHSLEALRSESPWGVALIAEAGGRGAWERRDLERAEELWLLARGCDPELAPVAENLVRLYLQKMDWDRALDEQGRLVRLLPPSDERQSMLKLLERAASEKVSVETLFGAIARIEMNTGEILAAVQTSRGLLQNIMRQRDEGRSRWASGETERDTLADELIDKLHNLIEDSSQVQLVRVREAHEALGQLLGPALLSLHPNSQYFLVSAEVFFQAGKIIAADVDSALIAVEYAKAVETELRRGLLGGLERRLDSSGRSYAPLDFGRKNREGEAQPFKRPASGTWIGALQDPAFTFSSITALISSGLQPQGDARVRKYLEDLKVPFGWSNFQDDLRKVRVEYRNGAAHVERLSRAKVEEFRALLFEGQLLKRLATLSSLARQLSPD